MSYKTVKYFLLISVIALFVTCTKKNLEIEPRNELPTEIAVENPNLMLTGIYALLGSGGIENQQEGALYATDLLLVPDLLAGEQYMGWTGTFSQYRQIRNKTMVPSNSSVVRIWKKAYMTINLANTLMNHLPSTTPEVFKAQALFVRGILHFELVRLFAEQYDPSTSASSPGVPLVLTATESFEEVTSPSRAKVEVVYQQIIKDLKDAQQLLPANFSDIIRSETISAFLSRVYLQKGDYENALSAANDVIEGGNYQLAGKLTDVFNTNGSTEHVFVIEQTQNQNAGTANDGLTTFYGCNPLIPAATGRGDVNVSSSFLAEYDSADVRGNTLIYQGTCSKESLTSAKWKNPYTNIPIIRLAEMYLTRAECNFRLGSDVGAPVADDINKIRLRAGVSLYEPSALTLDTILLEREHELAFEGLRIHDKRRVNAFYETRVNDSTSTTMSYRSPKFVMPIPQVELNSNKNLVQNPAYQ